MEAYVALEKRGSTAELDDLLLEAEAVVSDMELNHTVPKTPEKKDDKNEKISVVCRFRPENDQEVAALAEQCVTIRGSFSMGTAPLLRLSCSQDTLMWPLQHTRASPSSSSTTMSSLPTLTSRRSDPYVEGCCCVGGAKQHCATVV